MVVDAVGFWNGEACWSSFFFFSSRRRHTRLQGDWSSDVCSSDLPNIDDRDVVLVDDVLYTGRTIRAALDALCDFGRMRTIQLAVLIDRGHRELPIEANFIGKKITTKDNEVVEVKLTEIDGEDAIYVMEKI